MHTYTTTTVGRVRWWIDSARSKPWRPLIEPLLADPDRALDGWASFARARAGRKRFYHVRPESGHGAGLFIKAFGPPEGSWSWIRQRARSRARHEASVAQAIAARGVATAAPIVVGEEREGACLVRSFSIIAEIPARDLRSLLLDPETRARKRRSLVQGFGTFTRRLHDAGVDQDDSSPNNFLVDASGGFVLIDFERCRVRRPLGSSRRFHLLAKLQRHGLGVSSTDRLRFLHAYLGEPSRKEVRAAWSGIQRQLRWVRRRDARRAARGAFQIGRWVARDGTSWVIRGREDCPVIHFAMPPDEARDVWVRAHQLERLGLPALRPARLTPAGVDFVRPPAASTGASPHSVERARRALERYGRFKDSPEWEATEEGATLRDLRAFELRMGWW